MGSLVRNLKSYIMKNRVLLFLMALIFSLNAAAQPPETNYLGTVIATGFKQSIPLASDGPFPIGFTFTFFGNTYTEFYVRENGLVMFSNPDSLYKVESTIPSVSTLVLSFIGNRPRQLKNGYALRYTDLEIIKQCICVVGS